MIIYLIFEVTATFLESYLCFLFIHQLLFGPDNTKCENQRLLLLAIILTAGIIFFNTIKLFSVYTIILGIVFVCLSYVLFFGCNILDVLAATGFYYLCLNVIDFLSISVLGMVFRNSQFGMMVISDYSLQRVLHIVLTKTILFFCYLLIKRVMVKRINVIARKLLLGVVAGFVLVYYLGVLTFKDIDLNIALNWFFFLMIIAALCYTLWTYNKYRHEKENARIVKVRNDLIVQQYEELLANDKINATFYHNINNHHLVISNYLKEKKYNEALAYLSEIGEVVTEVYESVWTSDVTFDFILNYKKQESERLGIDYFANTDTIRFEQIDSSDLCNILGNLLDNAIDACKLVNNGKKWIRINVRKINRMIIIKIENTMEILPVKINHSLISSKSNQKLHGWGLKSVETIIDKLGGTISYNYDDNIFTVIVALF